MLQIPVIQCLATIDFIDSFPSMLHTIFYRKSTIVCTHSCKLYTMRDLLLEHFLFIKYFLQFEVMSKSSSLNMQGNKFYNTTRLVRFFNYHSPSTSNHFAISYYLKSFILT
jgi:hypothetical protein